MAIAFVQEVAAGGTPSNSFTLVLTLGAITTHVGNHLVLVAASRNGAITGVVDSKGNTWQADHASSGTGAFQDVWSCQLTSALVAADTITLSNSTSSGKAAVAAEFAGLATSSWLDKQVGATFVTGTAADSGATATTAQADELLVGMVGHQTTVTAFTPEALSPSWNQLSAPASVATVQTVRPMWRIVSATGAYSAKATWTTSRVYGAAIATYKAASVPTGQLPSEIGATVRDLGPTATVRDLGPSATVMA